jgi:serine/threonine protein kinase
LDDNQEVIAVAAETDNTGFRAWGDGLKDLPKSILGYEVLQRLGEGAASTIYAVSHPTTKQVYALKHVVKKTEKDQRFIEQCETEFEVCKLFKHAVLRKCHELKYGKSMFMFVKECGLVMELVEGVPLSQHRPENIGTIIECFLQVAAGIGAMHYQRYVHCDLKPSNILLDEKSGQVKLIDFGQAAKIGTAKERIQGTPDFIAPEQVKLKAVTERTDVFNYGATLYWTLTGKTIPTLFTIDKGQREILDKQLYPTPSELNAKVPEALSHFVMRCVQVFPGHRPKDMEEVGSLLAVVKAKVVAEGQ